MGRSPEETFAPLFEPANQVLDAAVDRVRQAFAAGTEIPPEFDVRAAGWIEDLDVPRATKEILLSWMAAVGGGDPGEQSILMLIGDLALTGFSLGASMEDVGESFANGTAALVGALEADIRGETCVASSSPASSRTIGPSASRRRTAARSRPMRRWSLCR